MNIEVLVSCVLEARELLRFRDGDLSLDSIATLLERALIPLHSASDTLPSPITSKLEEIRRRLPQLAEGRATAGDIEALEILLLGIWIRLETMTGDYS